MKTIKVACMGILMAPMGEALSLQKAQPISKTQENPSLLQKTKQFLTPTKKKALLVAEAAGVAGMLYLMRNALPSI